ncbi:hypothetical protein Bbelb_127840 [Branchiostoma belcheri]|nr:hypothetical protein Bbelb_127840 [Branchiostoma belcheri]
MLADTMRCLVGFLVVITNVVVLSGADTNIAVGRPAFQTSTSVHYSTDGVPSRAVDGNLNSNYRGLSCTHTLSEHNPAWWVDLGNSFPINRVTVFNRQDCCWERINPFNIHVGDSDQVSTNPRCVGDYRLVPGQTYVSLPCYNMRGRYVGILLPGYDRILTLCEAAATTPAVTTTTPAVTTTTPAVTTTTPAVTTTTPAVATTTPAVTTTTPAVTTPTPAVTTTTPSVTTSTPAVTTTTPAGTTTTPAGTTTTPVTTTVRSSNDASIMTTTMSQPKDPTSPPPTASLTTSRLGEGGSAAANKGGAPGGAVAGGVTGAMVLVGAGITIGGFLLYRKKKKVAVEPTPSERAESS